MIPKQQRELEDRIESIEIALLGSLENKGQGLVSAQQAMASELYCDDGICVRLKRIEAHVEGRNKIGWFRAGWIAGAGAVGGVAVWLLQKINR
jgi:hypothetical protein